MIILQVFSISQRELWMHEEPQAVLWGSILCRILSPIVDSGGIFILP